MSEVGSVVGWLVGFNKRKHLIRLVVPKSLNSWCQSKARLAGTAEGSRLDFQAGGREQPGKGVGELFKLQALPMANFLQHQGHTS